jgi:hypothetical protein
MVVVASSRCAWPVDHTPDAGGVVALCGLVRALPLDSVVPRCPGLDLVNRDSVPHAGGSLSFCVLVCVFLFMLSFSSPL